MKLTKSYLAATLGIAAFVVGGVACVAPVRAQTSMPVAEWSFDEGMGTASADTAGHGYTGTLVGNAGWGMGVVGPNALHLTGATGGFFDVPKAVVDTSRSYTVSAWVKLNSMDKAYQTFVSIDGSQVSGFFLQMRGDSGLFAMSVLPTDDTTANTPAVAASGIVPQVGVWYHLVGVYDANAQKISFYLNGALQGTANFTTPWRAEGHTVIGRGKFNSGPTDYANADIDDVRFYDTALSAEDVMSMSRRGGISPTLRIDAGQPAAKVSPMLYGLMTEEINYSYDGGLYAELIHNRAFKENPATPTHWILFQDGGSTGSMALDTTQPLNDATPASLKLTVASAAQGGRVVVANSGYWGIPVQPDAKYRASFWAKAGPDFKGAITVAVEGNDGKTVYAKGEIGKLSTEWKRYETELKIDSKATPGTDARFLIGTNATGSVNLTQISLFAPTYEDRANGNRVDLMQKMADMKPAFLRMPGGNYLEGNTVAERFDWKKTIGPVETRPGHQGPWGYLSTDGMGLLEFAEWCEDLHMEPLLAVYAGYSLKGEHIAAGTDLVPYVQDALDEIEYLTGDKTTHWGAQRIQDGHPMPFTLHYVEIGNEDDLDHSGSYEERFPQFYDAIKAKYPQLQLIATRSVKSRKPDVIDEHYYLVSHDMAQRSLQYDSYSRSGPKIFVGEWASQIFPKPWEHSVNESAATPNWEASLGDAAWLTGMERNSDIVVMESYAPLLVNINPGGRQWSQNLIGYDALNSYGSPSYYVQTMFANNHGDSILHATMTGAVDLYQSVTKDTLKGIVYVKVVNTSSKAQSVKVDVHDLAGIQAGQDATAITMVSGDPMDTNTILDPTKIVPMTTKVVGAGPTFTYSFQPYSVTVLVLGGK